MYTILGATGNIGRKAADILIKRGEKVRLVARSADRLRPFVGKHAQAFSGDALDTEFLANAFKGSDAVFVLLPPNPHAEKFLTYADAVGESIARALQIVKVKHVVNISSLGAELSDGTGPIVGLHNQEERLNRIPGLNVLHMRCAFFMENLLMNIDLIKSRNVIGSALRGDIKLPMIATKDIAAAVADRLVKRDFTGSVVEVLLGERDLTMIEAAAIIGKKINKPGLPYVMFPYDEAEKGLISAGLSPDMSRTYSEMNKAFNEGRILSTVKRTAQNTTSTSLEQFCDEVLAPMYTQKKAA